MPQMNLNPQKLLSLVAGSVTAVMLALSPAQAQDAMGAGRGGGGELRPSELAQPAHVVSAVFNGIRLLKYALHRWEREYLTQSEDPYKIWETDRKDELEILRLMFHKRSGENAISALMDLKFDILKKGNCFEPSKHEPRPSSYTPKTKTVCVSVPKVLEVKPNQNRLTVREAQNKVVVLLGHEIAHRMNATEAQAKAFEKMIDDYTDFESIYQLYSRHDGFRRELSEMNTQARTIQKMLKDSKTTPFAETCRFVDAMVRTALDWDKKDRRPSLYQPLSNPTQGRLFALGIQVRFMAGYCENPEVGRSPVPVFWGLEPFGSKDTLTLKELIEDRKYATLPSEMIPGDYPPFIRPIYGDIQKLQQDIAQVITETSRLYRLLEDEDKEIRMLQNPVAEFIEWGYRGYIFRW